MLFSQLFSNIFTYVILEPCYLKNLMHVRMLPPDCGVLGSQSRCLTPVLKNCHRAKIGQDNTFIMHTFWIICSYFRFSRRGQLKCNGTRTETRFRLSAKRTSPFKSAGGQFSRLLAAEVCASAVVMLDTPCSEVVWRVLTTHFIRQFPLHFSSRASPCAIKFQLESAAVLLRHHLPNESWRNFIINRCVFVKAVSTPRSSINFWRPRSASALDTDDRHAATNSCCVITFSVGFFTWENLWHVNFLWDRLS